MMMGPVEPRRQRQPQTGEWGDREARGSARVKVCLPNPVRACLRRMLERTRQLFLCRGVGTSPTICRWYPGADHRVLVDMTPPDQSLRVCRKASWGSRGLARIRHRFTVRWRVVEVRDTVSGTCLLCGMDWRFALVDTALSGDFEALRGGRMGAIARARASGALGVVPIVTPSRSAAQSWSSRRMPQRFPAQIRQHLAEYGRVYVSLRERQPHAPRRDADAHRHLQQLQA